MLHFRVLNDSYICTTHEESMQAAKHYRNVLRKAINECSIPCKLLHFTVAIGRRGKAVRIGKRRANSQTVLSFQKWIRVDEEKDLYPSLTLFAEVGGYVGIFIGYSPLNLVDSIYSFMKSRLNM